MEKKTIFVKDILLQELCDNIQERAEKMAEVGKVFKKVFPSMPWSVDAFLGITQNYELREYTKQKIREQTAQNFGLNCCYGTPPDKISHDIIMNRKMVEFHTVDDLKTLSVTSNYFMESKGIITYLRTGAIYVDKNEQVVIAKNANDLLKDYCSVTIENSKEANFMAGLIEAGKAAKVLCSQFVSLSKLADVDGCDILHHSGYVDRLHLCDGMLICSDSMPRRAFVKFIAVAREKDSPRFFNRQALPKVTAESIFRATGYLLGATAQLRSEYPALYKNVPYRGYVDSVNNYDSAESLQIYEYNKNLRK